MRCLPACGHLMIGILLTPVVQPCAALCSLRMFYPSWPWWAKDEMIGGRVGMPLASNPASELALGKADIMPKNKLVWMTLASTLCRMLRKNAMHVFGTRRRKARRRAAQLAHGIFDLTTVEPSSSIILSPEPILLAGYRRNKALYALDHPMADFNTLPIDSRVISDGAIRRAPWPPVG